MNASLTRAMQGKKARPCAKPNHEEAPISGWILAAVVAGVLVFGFAMDVHTAMAALIKAIG
jgi:hypothetical protein